MVIVLRQRFCSFQQVFWLAAAGIGQIPWNRGSWADPNSHSLDLGRIVRFSHALGNAGAERKNHLAFRWSWRMGRHDFSGGDIDGETREMD
jgi:hypothetical protein